MKLLIRFSFGLLSLLLLTSVCLQAQTLYKLSPESSLTISGTSTLHDWTATAETLSGEGRFSLEAGKLSAITGLQVEVVVKSIKSGKGAMMDNNTRKALKASQHPTIRYQLLSFEPLSGGKYLASGKLTIAGVSKTVQLPVSALLQVGNVIIEGKLPILMRDYNIDPPTAMMGTIKTGEEVTVAFRACFTAAKQLSENK